MTRIKMIATDVDGTFLNQERRYNHERFARQLHQLTTAGIHFVVASGNHLGHLYRVFAPTPAVQTFVAENGGLIVDQGKTLFEDIIPTPTVHQIVADILADDTLRPQVLRLSGAHGTYINQRDRPSDPVAQDYFFNNIVRVADLTQVDDTFYKINGEWPNDTIQHVAARLNHRFPGQINAMASGFGSIDIVAAHMNKAIGITQLAESWGIKPAEIAAFGDNDNDRDMLAHVGLGVAMQNGTDTVKAVANLISPTDNNHDGVLNVIDAILAGEV
ncbi:Cof-type HAD-IIB family hydrolase [Levilactobacillus brevis]|uniref:Cof-type HAD-IIB family hydrolase n=1 Tax=Levilactobacillus hammesii TaxID=267633 RepID=A0A921F0U1_9LACO|nr:Cof-type HAD-IIB family hydrolase [Levilactobacillus brevis]HJE86579.1 Cof-type HAD-IIB family hydrolase [Levilactobacillus hammesii]